MKQCKRCVIIFLMILLVGTVMTGCGADTDQEDTTQSEATTAAGIGNTTQEDDSADSDTENIEGDGADGVDGTGNTDEDASVGEDNGGAVGEAAEDVGEATDDVADGVGEATDDIADGAGDALDNLGGGSFDQYDDAKSYLLDKLGKDNAKATYEVREEKEDLVSYNSTDADARGYEFHVYETDGNEKIGTYYVDKETGKIYRYMGKDSIEAY